MLPVQHRLTRSGDFSAVMKGGTRAGTGTVVVAVRFYPHGEASTSVPADGTRWRCGFVVSKAVGNAVIRHRTTRRLRHIIAQLLREEPQLLPQGGRTDIVVRALAEAPAAEHARLSGDVRSGLRRAVKKWHAREQESA
ncbi:ribonuclease P protein component [Nesterenkonia flava]|uniref:Ribonuclease P protein component n=1 Tax=Nesterenkonia flava TaxID=469799 RepID=A0ABU1FT09_9MICC|nr:ribonuclease P protein component [Nesterenkonia flava]MDR5711796.1 ribonuclease P protein component [Nesterenkonia flava]